jgi:hypothetical protein
MSQDHQLTAVLQLVRLKGRVAPTVAGESLGLAEPEVRALLEQLRALGAVTETNDNFRISPEGRQQLAARTADERQGIAQAPLAHAYELFHPLNSEFKVLVTTWQLKGGAPNDHSDMGYDADIIGQLTDLDSRFTPLLAQMVSLAPRLAPYPRRLTHALQRLLAGDHSAFARPIADSYHTVWFELHEDLIGMLGLSREAEAAAGRAE